MGRCAVFECTNDAGIKFPIDNTLKQQWVRATRVDVKRKDGWQLTKSSRICYEHFTSNDFLPSVKRRMIKKTAVPSIFPWTSKHGDIGDPDEIRFNPVNAYLNYSRPTLPIIFVEEYPYLNIEITKAGNDPLKVEYDSSDETVVAIAANRTKEHDDCATESRGESQPNTTPDGEINMNVIVAPKTEMNKPVYN